MNENVIIFNNCRIVRFDENRTREEQWATQEEWAVLKVPAQNSRDDIKLWVPNGGTWIQDSIGTTTGTRNPQYEVHEGGVVWTIRKSAWKRGTLLSYLIWHFQNVHVTRDLTGGAHCDTRCADADIDTVDECVCRCKGFNHGTNRGDYVNLPQVYPEYLRRYSTETAHYLYHHGELTNVTVPSR